jgi:hypothetical protein
MSETRKLAAILIADVVGYSRLAVADEERTLARLGPSAAISPTPPLRSTTCRIVTRTGRGGERALYDHVRQDGCRSEVIAGAIHSQIEAMWLSCIWSP